MIAGGYLAVVVAPSDVSGQRIKVPFSIMLISVNSSATSMSSACIDPGRARSRIARDHGFVIVHSDRGSQYCSGLFQDTLKAYGMRSSMSRRGDGWDNAPTESLWGSLKVARLHGRNFATRRAAMDEIVDWLGFYNSRRLHSTLDYVSPMTFEKNRFAAQQGRAA